MELVGKPDEAVRVDNSLGELPFGYLPLGKVQLFVVLVAFFGFAQKLSGDGFDLAVSRSTKESESSDCISSASTMSFSRTVADIAPRRYSSWFVDCRRCPYREQQIWLDTRVAGVMACAA